MLGIRTVIWKDKDFETILDAISKAMFDVNNDFNGTNGDEFLSDAAYEGGYDSDLEYVKDVMRKANANKPMNAEAMVAYFINVMFDDPEWYPAYKYEMITHPELGVIGATVAWINV